MKMPGLATRLRKLWGRAKTARRRRARGDYPLPFEEGESYWSYHGSRKYGMGRGRAAGGNARR